MFSPNASPASLSWRKHSVTKCKPWQIHARFTGETSYTRLPIANVSKIAHRGKDTGNATENRRTGAHSVNERHRCPHGFHRNSLGRLAALDNPAFNREVMPRARRGESAKKPPAMVLLYAQNRLRVVLSSWPDTPNQRPPASARDGRSPSGDTRLSKRSHPRSGGRYRSKRARRARR